MQIVSYRDNLHEMSKPIFWENKKNINLSSAELAQRVVEVKMFSSWWSCGRPGNVWGYSYVKNLYNKSYIIDNQCFQVNICS